MALLRTLESGVTCIAHTEDREVSLSVLMAITIALFIDNLLLNIAIANYFCVVLTCGHFSKTAAEEEATGAMAPPLGMATARTNMATAGGSGDDTNDCNKQERAR